MILAFLLLFFTKTNFYLSLLLFYILLVLLYFLNSYFSKTIYYINYNYNDYYLVYFLNKFFFNNLNKFLVNNFNYKYFNFIFNYNFT